MSALPCNRNRLLLPLTAILALAAASVGQANPDVYQRTLRGTAWVISPRSDKDMSLGTGVLVDGQRRLVLTNYHVVQERTQAFVLFPLFQQGTLVTDPNVYSQGFEKLAVSAQVLVRDVKRDLAVLQLESLPAGAVPVAIAAASPRPAETVHAIGNSGVEGQGDGTLGGTLWRYSKGEVRQVYRRKFRSRSEGAGAVHELDARVVETQVPSNPGDSGGPVVNDRGELVAITQSGDFQKQRLITYGVDVTEVRAVLARASNPAPAVAALGGAWTSTRAAADGTTERLRMEFHAGGRFVFITSTASGTVKKTTEGRYAFTDGRLTLAVTGQRPRDGEVSFVSDDAFILKGTGRETRWARADR